MKLTFHWRPLKSAIRDAWPVGLLVAGAVLASLIAWLVSTTLSDAVRYAGMMLQIGGLAVVAFGLRQIRRRFNRPSLWETVLSWLRRVALLFKAPKIVEAYGTSQMENARVSGKGEAIRTMGPDATLDERVTILEENVNRLQEDLDTKIHQMRQELGAVSRRLAQETQERRAEDRLTARRIEELAVGGLHLEMVGLTWLIVGLIGTSIPDEIVWLASLAKDSTRWLAS